MFFYGEEVERARSRHGLPDKLVIAVVLVESSGNRHAWNPEPRYRYLWDVVKKRPFRVMTEAEMVSEKPPGDFPALAGDRDQEWWGQQASWGLMQVMGAVAREHGFQEPYLPQLTEVGYNLEMGCSVLSGHMRWAMGDTSKALGAYNAGRGNWSSEAGRAYAAKVLRQLAQL